MLLLLGAAWRLVWVCLGDRLAPLRSELRNVALTFASTGRIADAYGAGVGPTAHVSPVMPVFEGLVYRALGDNWRAEMALTVVAVALASASFVFVYRCFKILGLPLIWRLCALAAVCLIPINAMIEVRQLRGFEGMLATAMGTGLLLWILDLDQKPRLRLLEIAPLALVMAVLAFIHQAAALGVYGAAGLLILRRTSWRMWPAIGAVFAVMLAVVLLPWAARNQQVMHHPLLTRSNFGLELAQAYYPGALNPPDEQYEYKRRHFEMHPMASAASLAKVRQMGEVEYSASMARETEAWMRAHPKETLILAARYFRQFWFPDPWLWQSFDSKVRTSYKLKSAAVWLMTGCGFIGLALGLRRRFGVWIYVAPALLLPSLPYVLAQPIIRYRYIVSTLLVFCAFELVRALYDQLARPSQGGSPITEAAAAQ